MSRILGAAAGFYTTIYLLFALLTEGVTLVPNTGSEIALMTVGTIVGLVSVR